jgi:uncharacterized membrane protein
VRSRTRSDRESEEALSQRVQETVELQAPAADVFRYWSNFENFSTFMSNVEEVRVMGTESGTEAAGQDPPASVRERKGDQ